jgi:hypothetical protein
LPDFFGLEHVDDAMGYLRERASRARTGVGGWAEFVTVCGRAGRTP